MIDDMPALLSWVEDEILKAHNTWCDDCEYINECRIMEDEIRTDILCALDVREKAFSDMRNKILNNPTELHRTLTNKPITEVRSDPL